jgi:predicted AAA+ superfamily ATPase
MPVVTPRLNLKAPVPRHAEPRVRAALADTRVVAIVGPRQSGKSTLARKLAADRPYLTLDDEQTRAFAQSDPTGFVRGLDLAVIDEIQRAPGLVLAIKRSVDEDPRPGRFLITGSADLFAGSIAPDSLAGRVETIELLPLSQAEIERAPPPTFLDRAFAGALGSGKLGANAAAGPTPDLIDRILTGGFPEALARASPERRSDWLRAYARSLAERDVADLAHIGKGDMMSVLIEHAALMSGRLLNMTELGGKVGVDAKTIDRWLALLEKIFLVRRIRPWFRNDLQRLVKTPKLQFVDSGLLAALTGVDAARVARDRDSLGPLTECFVYSELAKAIALGEPRTTLAHYRDKDQVEVDFVLERGLGRIVGVEVKAGATVRPDDFRGLARLRDAVGSGFVLGVLIHDGERIAPFGDRLVAAPFSSLWR